jgi:regulator of sigma E protease
MSWLLVFLGFCMLIILHEAGHYVAAKATGMRVESFFLFFGPKLWSFKRGETEYGVKVIPLGGYVKINGMNPEEEMPPGEEDRAYCKQKVWKRIVVVAAGPAVNIALCFVILVAVFGIGGLESADQSVAETTSPPATKVLQEGDKLVAIDGHSFPGLGVEQRLERFGKLVRSHECAGQPTDGCVAKTPVVLTVDRDGQRKTIAVKPRYNAEANRMLVGFAYGGHFEPISFSTAVNHSLDSMGEVVSRTAHVFSHIFESKERGEISGVVGTSDVGHSAIEAGWRQALLLLALVSLSLGVINLLPILPLDGGHIFWAIVEKLRGGKPASMMVMERASVIGFALVMIIVFIGLGNDIGRITGEGFNVR